MTDTTFETNIAIDSDQEKQPIPDSRTHIAGQLAVENSVSNHEADEFAERRSEILHASRQRRQARLSGQARSSSPPKSVNDLIRLQIKELSVEPLLTADDEKVLGKGVQAGIRAGKKADKHVLSGEPVPEHLLETIDEGKAARDRFIRANMRLVISIAKDYDTRTGMDISDYIQEGSVGLATAAVKFDPEKGFKFSTYATSWIKQAIARGIDERGTTIKVPRDHSRKVRSEMRYYRDEEKLSEELAVIHRIMNTGSLDKQIRSDKDDTYADRIIAEADTEQAALSTLYEQEKLILVRQALSGLKDADLAYEVLLAKFGFVDGVEKTYEIIAAEFDITYHSARQTIYKALEALRSSAALKQEFNQAA